MNDLNQLYLPSRFGPLV